MATERKVFHSSNTSSGWVVTSGGQVLENFDNQADAEAAAMRMGKKAQEEGGLGQAVLHKADGEIREERTYGKDPEKSPG